MAHDISSMSDANSLKNINFVTWRVERAKDRLHRKEVNRELWSRPRLRGDQPETQH